MRTTGLDIVFSGSRQPLGAAFGYLLDSIIKVIYFHLLKPWQEKAFLLILNNRDNVSVVRKKIIDLVVVNFYEWYLKLESSCGDLSLHSCLPEKLLQLKCNQAWILTMCCLLCQVPKHGKCLPSIGHSIGKQNRIFLLEDVPWKVKLTILENMRGRALLPENLIHLIQIALLWREQLW